MSVEGPTRVRQITAAMPLAVLVGAAVVGLGSPSGPTADTAADVQQEKPVDLPVIEDGFEDPASVSDPKPKDNTGLNIRTVADNTNIPPVALAAYHKSALVMDRTESSCGLPWSILAGIGKVESDHGRYGGGSLDSDGVAEPSIIGIALDGSSGTRVISDTDAGKLDKDRTYDRAVGPMQFIPGTWAQVGVDADDDGIRDPQDIDDASLAAGVYLCYGGSDLSTEAGQRAAVHRYNHSDQYVDLVLSLAKQYEEGDYVDDTAPPTATPDADQPSGGDDDSGNGGGDGSDSGSGSDDGSGNGGTDNGGSDNGGTQPDDDEQVIAGSEWTIEDFPGVDDSGDGNDGEQFPDISDGKPNVPDDGEPTDDSTDSGDGDGEQFPGGVADPKTPKPTNPSKPTKPTTPTTPTAPPTSQTPTPEIPYIDPTVPSEDTELEAYYLANAQAICGEAGHVDDVNLTDDPWDLCIQEQIWAQRAATACEAAGLVDDPAREDDTFDQCVAQSVALGHDLTGQ